MRTRTVRLMIATILIGAVAVSVLIMQLCGIWGKQQALRIRRDRMHYIAYSLENYRAVVKALPPNTHRDEMGRPLTSWRHELLPFIEQLARHHDNELPWFAPASLPWLVEPVADYYTLDKSNDKTRTFAANLVAITGPGTAFPDDYGFDGELPRDLILLIEIADSDWAWTQPGDLDIREIPASVAQGADGQGVHVAFVDCSVWYLKPSVPVDLLHQFFTIEGAQVHNREQDLLPFRQDEP